ncbi:MAG: LutC/YkgG family protein [Hyphomicrobiaceae bacterium]
MKSARDHILARIRQFNGPRKTDLAAIDKAAAELLATPGETQPQFGTLSTREKFVERATSARLTATVDEVSGWKLGVKAAQDYLSHNSLSNEIAMPPSAQLQALDWGETLVRHEITPNEPVSLSVADYGLAETGTLVFTSRSDNPTLFHFLGLHHIAFVAGVTILDYIEDYWSEVRGRGNVQPRTINFITGTSGTADIEAQNTRGAHGPRFLHIIIID